MAHRAKATLTIRDGRQRGLSFDVLPTTTIGRSNKSVVWVDDPDVSRTHVVIDFDAGEYVVRDNGSANGTFLNGRRINAAALRHGDVIGLGGSTLLFEVGVARPLKESIAQAARLDTAQPPFAQVSRASGVDALEAALTKYKVLFQTNEVLSRLMHGTPAFTQALELLANVMGADLGVVLLGTTEAELEIVAEYRRSGHQAHSALSSTLLKRVLGDGEAVLVLDTLHDERLSDSESVLSTGSRSMVCVPLRANDETFGALQLECSSRPTAFNNDDLQMVVALARQAAIVLGHARTEKARAEAVERAECEAPQWVTHRSQHAGR